MTGAAPAPAPGRRRLLIVSSVRWGYLWQRHQALAVAAADDGWSVDFLEPHPRRVMQVLRFVAGRLRRSGPFTQATPVPQGVRVLGQSAWLRRQRPGYDLVLCYVPDRSSIRRARRAGSRIVYDAVLDWSAVPASWYPPVGWRRSEAALARAATVVTTDSRGTQVLLEQRGIPSTVVHPAADTPFLTALPRPVPRTAVYFGSVRDEVDTDVLTGLARSGFAVSVIGPIDRETTRDALVAGGVVLHDPVDVDRLAQLVGANQFVLLPYRGSRGSSLMPAKFWNCLASGRWVVAGGIDVPVEAPNVVLVDGGPERWRDVLEQHATALLPDPVEVVPTWEQRWRTIAALAGL